MAAPGWSLSRGRKLQSSGSCAAHAKSHSKSGRFLIMLAERSYSEMEPCYRKSKAEVSVAFTTTTTTTTTVVDGPARDACLGVR